MKLIFRLNESTYVLIFFLFLSLLNCIVFLGENSFVSYVVGELIIVLFGYDLLKTKYRLHIYQILLVYFYFSLCITNSFSGFHDEHHFYMKAYVVNLLHFIFFALGYCFYKYRSIEKIFKNKQNKILSIYLVFSLMVAVLSLNVDTVSEGYSDRFLAVTAEQARSRLNVIDYISGNVFGSLKHIFMFTFSNPFIYSIYNVLMGSIGYVASGIKGNVLGPVLVLLMVYQFYYKNISVRALLILFPLALFALAFLIGTTVFRGQLSLMSLMGIELEQMKQFLLYFLRSPESRHIFYTADVMGLIESGDTNLRYGFDYFRFILYPFKGIFENFEYASFVQYPSILEGKPVNQGQYLGFAGELYWNFGYLFFVFSFFLGMALKWFTNLAFSNRAFGVVSYLLLFKTILWIFYRGIGNELTIVLTMFILAIILFLVLKRLINRFTPLARLFSKW